jgi:hypothetical protein
VSDAEDLKPKAQVYLTKTLVPSSWGLLEVVERFLELSNVCGMHEVDEAWRLLVVHSLIEEVIEAGILHVELMGWPGAGRGDVASFTTELNVLS